MGGKRILVADDDPVTLETLAAQLRGAGYQVVTAMDAMQAFMVAQRSAPDAVLLDIQMPGGTGLDTLKRLRASSKTQTIPVLAMSGLVSPPTPPESHEARPGEPERASMESWRRPTLPRPRDRSTIGADRLNDRVRDGNGCGPVALVASKELTDECVDSWW